jgi:hypothetical protein
VAVDDQGHPVGGAANRPNPEDDVADVAAPVADEEQVAGAQRLPPRLVRGGQLDRWRGTVRPSTLPWRSSA